MTIERIQLKGHVNTYLFECMEEISPRIDRVNAFAKKFFAASAILGIVSIPLGILLPPVGIITGGAAAVCLIAAIFCKAYAGFLSAKNESFKNSYETNLD